MHKLIKWKENELHEESRRNSDHWCKNKKTNVKLGEGNLKHKNKTLLKVKTPVKMKRNK